MAPQVAVGSGKWSRRPGICHLLAPVLHSNKEFIVLVFPFQAIPTITVSVALLTHVPSWIFIANGDADVNPQGIVSFIINLLDLLWAVFMVAIDTPLSTIMILVIWRSKKNLVHLVVDTPPTRVASYSGPPLRSGRVDMEADAAMELGPNRNLAAGIKNLMKDDQMETDGPRLLVGGVSEADDYLAAQVWTPTVTVTDSASLGRQQLSTAITIDRTPNGRFDTLPSVFGSANSTHSSTPGSLSRTQDPESHNLLAFVLRALRLAGNPSSHNSPVLSNSSITASMAGELDAATISAPPTPETKFYTFPRADAREVVGREASSSQPHPSKTIAAGTCAWGISGAATDTITNQKKKHQRFSLPSFMRSNRSSWIPSPSISPSHDFYLLGRNSSSIFASPDLLPEISLPRRPRSVFARRHYSHKKASSDSAINNVGTFKRMQLQVQRYRSHSSPQPVRFTGNGWRPRTSTVGDVSTRMQLQVQRHRSHSSPQPVRFSVNGWRPRTSTVEDASTQPILEDVVQPNDAPLEASYFFVLNPVTEYSNPPIAVPGNAHHLPQTLPSAAQITAIPTPITLSPNTPGFDSGVPDSVKLLPSPSSINSMSFLEMEQRNFKQHQYEQHAPERHQDDQQQPTNQQHQQVAENGLAFQMWGLSQGTVAEGLTSRRKRRTIQLNNGDPFIGLPGLHVGSQGNHLDINEQGAPSS
ncbi:hypothetical protein HK102_011916 [Quaeritorhiza haematococci]|nr:hypothetical protein HK102_011916 [Quaeritorhiza haematococci]